MDLQKERLVLAPFLAEGRDHPLKLVPRLVDRDQPVRPCFDEGRRATLTAAPIKGGGVSAEFKAAPDDLHEPAVAYRLAGERARMTSTHSRRRALRTDFTGQRSPVMCSFIASPLPSASQNRPGNIWASVAAACAMIAGCSVAGRVHHTEGERRRLQRSTSQDQANDRDPIGVLHRGDRRRHADAGRCRKGCICLAPERVVLDGGSGDVIGAVHRIGGAVLGLGRRAGGVLVEVIDDAIASVPGVGIVGLGRAKKKKKKKKKKKTIVGDEFPSCSRLSPFTTKPGALTKSSPASCSSIRFRRFTAPP